MQKHNKSVAELTAQQREKAYFDKLEKEVKHMELILKKRKLNQELGLMDTDTLGVLFMEVEAHIETKYPELLKVTQEARIDFLGRIGYKEDLYRENYKRFLADVVKSQSPIPVSEPQNGQSENPSEQLHVIHKEMENQSHSDQVIDMANADPNRDDGKMANMPDTSDEPNGEGGC